MSNFNKVKFDESGNLTNPLLMYMRHLDQGKGMAIDRVNEKAFLSSEQQVLVNEITEKLKGIMTNTTDKTTEKQTEELRNTLASQIESSLDKATEKQAKELGNAFSQKGVDSDLKVEASGEVESTKKTRGRS